MQRFWNKVNKTSNCWYWKASKRNGYGAFKFEGKVISAHRFSYTISYGIIPQGKLICHHCDNKLCVKPLHLFLGTSKDNVVDAIQKGRMNPIAPTNGKKFQSGEKHPFHKLTDKQVISIRKEYENPLISLKKLAIKYCVDKSLIWQIVRRKTRLNV
jgi:hypothetical protein